MKIKSAIISALLVLCIIAGTLFASSAANRKAGDVDFDNLITVEDALLVLRATSGATSFTAEQTKAADVTYDGKINSVDALRILLYISGNIPSLEKLSGDEGDDVII